MRLVGDHQPLATDTMFSAGGAAAVDVGECSNDECCICGQEWTDGEKGWVLCDSISCENCVCASCTQNLGLIVSDLFYCPPCSGSGESAAATVGGAVATAVAACAELEALPLSFKAVQKILLNLSRTPDEPKYRKLRLENKAVKKYVDLEPVLRILSSIGFVRREEERTVPVVPDQESSEARSLPQVEQVLVLEGSVDVGQIKEILEILDGLSPENNTNQRSGGCEDTKKIVNKEESTGEGAGDDSTKRGPDRSDLASSGADGAKRAPATVTDTTGEPETKKRKEGS